MILERQLARRMFFPERAYEGAPSDHGLEPHEVSFDSEGSTLHGWLIPGEGTPWLWSHGNGGNMSHRLAQAAFLNERLGVPLFLYDYRGYGRSEGTPSERGVYVDAAAALRALCDLRGVAPGDVVLYGQSLGGAVTVELATHCAPRAVILESTFTSVGAMARVLRPRLPVGPLLRGVFDSAARIKDVRAPVLVIHGDNDEIVPIELGRALYDAAREPKRWSEVAGARHDDVWLMGGDGYIAQIASFLASAKASNVVTG